MQAYTRLEGLRRCEFTSVDRSVWPGMRNVVADENGTTILLVAIPESAVTDGTERGAQDYRGILKTFAALIIVSNG